jgi:fibronectin-binding autotransporter adhesin
MELLHVADSTTLTYDGIIADASGESNNFTKDGNGTLDLGGANTYTGTTTISDGTLKVDGTLAQTAVTVASGATYDVDATDTVLSIAGAGTIDLTDAALTAGDTNPKPSQVSLMVLIPLLKLDLEH